MKLFGNPIFVTQRRLTHRAGVLTAILIAALIGLSLLSGLITYLAKPEEFNFASPQEAGRVFYGWAMALEIAVLIFGGFSKIARVLVDDRKAGLWESNWLTPLKPRQIVTGYWFGAPLREFYMAAVLAFLGMDIVLLGGLPITLWLGTQLLIASTALFVGLSGVLAGMAFQKQQNVVVLMLPLLFVAAIFIAFARLMITNFLLPIDAIANLFSNGSPDIQSDPMGDWNTWPHIFALPVPPILLTLGLQLVLGIFIWRATVRRTANPLQPLLKRWEAIAIFALLVVVQQSLVWGVWNGQFPRVSYENFADEFRFNRTPLLCIVQGGTIFVGVALLAFICPQPERLRIEVLRKESGNSQLVFSRSAVWPALVMIAVAAGALLTQIPLSFAQEGSTWMLAVCNLSAIFLMFVFLLEFSRLRFKRKALGFVALWLFVLCVLPLVLGGIFSNAEIAKTSFLSPGVVALSGRPEMAVFYGREYVNDTQLLVTATIAHFGVVVILFILWLRQWRRLLQSREL